MRPFTHPVDVPTDFAFAVQRVLHNRATAGDWKLFLQHDRDTARTWYEEILKRNLPPDMTVELVAWEGLLFDAALSWWADHLATIHRE